MRLIEYFDKGAELAPDRAFLIDADTTRCYREVQAESHRFAHGLRRAGVPPGAHVAVYSPNSSAAFAAVIGLLRGGCVWVPINVRNTIEDTIDVLTRTDTDALLYGAGLREQAHRILATCPRIRHAWCIERDDPPWPALHTLTDGTATTPYDTPAAMDDIVTLSSSGGTTGRSKGVMMSHCAWEVMVANNQRLMWHPSPVHLVAAPMTHAAGAVALAMMAMGTTNVILPGFDTAAVLAAIENHRVTHLFLPPTAIYRLLAHPGVRHHDYSSLRYFTYAAAPMAPARIREAIEVFGPVMMTAFGQTEIGVHATAFSPAEHAQAIASGNERRLLSCGRASPYTRIEIMDGAGRLLPAETPGEIVVRSSMVMQGYYRDPEETARARAFGWHHTGDIGIKDTDGWIYLLDRKRDMIISGGFNIFPSAIEKVILEHAAVQDCAVVGVPDPDWGEAVTAVLELKPGHVIDTEALRALCRERLSAYMVPKAFVVWPELPRSAIGKVLRREVRTAFWHDQPRRI